MDGPAGYECYVTENTAQRRTYRYFEENSGFTYELFDETGRLIRLEHYYEDGDLQYYDEYEYDEQGRPARANLYFVQTDEFIEFGGCNVFEYD